MYVNTQIYYICLNFNHIMIIFATYLYFYVI